MCRLVSGTASFAMTERMSAHEQVTCWLVDMLAELLLL